MDPFKPTKTVPGPYGMEMNNIEDITKAFESGALDFDRGLHHYAALAVEEKRSRDEARNIVTPVEDNDLLQIGPSNMPNFDRGVFVVKDTPAWQEVSCSRPLVSVVYEGQEANVCDWCYANSELPIDFVNDKPELALPIIKRCSGCKVLGYCSKECQQKAWSHYHKLECKAIKASAQQKLDPDFINGNTRTVTRLLCMHKMGTLSEEQLAILRQLPHRSDETFRIKQIRPGFQIDPQANLRRRAVASINATKSHMTPEQVYDLLTIVMAHTVCMGDDTLQPIAQGIVLLVTNLTHSCESNTTHFVYNGKFYIKATKDLKAGEELTTGYVYGGDEIDARRSELESHYGIKCECSKCLRELLEIRTAPPEQRVQRDKRLEAQKELDALISTAKNSGTQGNGTEQLKEQVSKIVKTVYPEGDWPLDLRPMPNINMMFITRCLTENDLAGFFMYTVRSVFGREPREAHNPRMCVEKLFTLDMFFRKFCGSIREKKDGFESFPLNYSRFMIVHYGYTIVLVHVLETMFHPNMNSAKVLRARLDKFVNKVLPDNFPGQKSKEFRRVFVACQRMLLTWAGVPKEKEIKLP